MRKKFVRILWVTLFTVVILLAGAFTAIWFGWIGYMPDLEDLQNPISRYASQVYSVDGKILGTYNMNKENRVHVDYEHLSPYLVRALVATEDERYYEHSGIDFIALTRAVVKRGIMGQKSRGWFYHHATVGQATLFGHGKKHSGAIAAETHRVGDCGETGTVLHQGGNHHHVSQLL